MWGARRRGLSCTASSAGSHGGESHAALLQAGQRVLGWTLMTAAMMLPTTLPLVIFRRLTSGRADRAQLVVLLILGYLGVWLAFRFAAHVFDLGLHAALHESTWLQQNAWIFGAGPLLVAGAFQFSKLKYAASTNAGRRSRS